MDDLEIVLVARERSGSLGSETAITLDLDARAGDQGVTHLQEVGPDEEIVVEVYSAAVEELTGFAVSVGVDTSQVFFQSAEAGANLGTWTLAKHVIGGAFTFWLWFGLLPAIS